MTSITPEEIELGNRLYETYAKPLEDEHRGEFIAILPNGRYVLGPTMRETAVNAKHKLGDGVYLFKVGDIAVGRWL